MIDRLVGTGPVGRQARTHALITAADASFGVSLAGSLFFSVSVDAARPRTVIYLVATMAPFAIVAPLIGPVIDRVPGGQRLVVAVTCAARGVICLVLARELRSLLFYPLAFAILVLGKTYSVAKNVLVPRLVADADALVEANSRLSRVAIFTGVVAGGLGGATVALAGAPWALRCGSALYIAAGAAALRLPRPVPSGRAPFDVEQRELRAPELRRAAATMGVLRGGEGFLLFAIAFTLKQTGEPAWFFGAVFAGNGLGAVAGTFVAPRARRVANEEALLAGAVALIAGVALIATFGIGRLTILGVAAMLGLSATVGRRAFDSLVQRDAPDVERGRLFARFEARFQLSWVLGAVVAVVARPPFWAALFVFGVIAGVATLVSVRGTHAAGRSSDDGRPESGPAGPGGSVSEGLLATAERLYAEGSLDQAVAVGVLAASLAIDQSARREGAEEPTPAQLEVELGRLRQLAVPDADTSTAQTDRVLSEARRLVSLAIRGHDGLPQ